MTKINNFIKNTVAGKIISWFLALFFPLYLILVAEFTNFTATSNYLRFLSKRIFLIIFLYIFLSLIIFTFAMIIKRFWVSAALFGTIVMICIYVNIIKYNITMYPFFPWDILLMTNLGQITGFVSEKIVITPKMLIGGIAFILYIILLIVTNLKLSFKKVNFVPFCSVVLLSGMFFTSPDIKDNFLPKLGLNDEMLKYQEYNYFHNNGFIGSFLQNCCNIRLDKSNQYDSSINKLYEKYKISDEKINEIKNIDYKPNIICIMSESFCDLRDIDGLELSEDIYKLYDEMAQNSIHGNLSVPVNGGGTSRSEFQFLSGLSLDISFDGALPYQQFVKNDIPTLASYTRAMNYQTVAIHPYLKKFYQREKVYPLIGFNKFVGLEDIENRTDFIKEDEYVTDDYLTNLIIEEIDEAEKNNIPLFLYAITMQNHYPYHNEKFVSFSNSVKTINELNETADKSMSSYASGVKESIIALKRLYDYINNSERPTILVFFGDHLPLIDDANLYFSEFRLSGKNAKIYNDYFQTSYFIYTNDKDKRVIKNNTTHVSMLGCDIIDLASFPQVQVFDYLDDMRKNSDFKFVNSMLALDKDGKYSFPQSDNEWITNHKIISYNLVRENLFTENFELLNKK